MPGSVVRKELVRAIQVRQRALELIVAVSLDDVDPSRLSEIHEEISQLKSAVDAIDDVTFSA